MTECWKVWAKMVKQSTHLGHNAMHVQYPRWEEDKLGPLSSVCYLFEYRCNNCQRSGHFHVVFRFTLFIILCIFAAHALEFNLPVEEEVCRCILFKKIAINYCYHFCQNYYCYYTGMDTKTSLHTSSGSLFVRDSLTHCVHVTSNVITYHCSASRRRGTIERRLTLLRNTWRDCYLNTVVPLECYWTYLY